MGEETGVNAVGKRRRKSRKGRLGKGRWVQIMKCFKCGKEGHMARYCRSKGAPKGGGWQGGWETKGGKAGKGNGRSGEEQGGTKFDGKCYRCGKDGHSAKFCKEERVQETREGEDRVEYMSFGGGFNVGGVNEMGQGRWSNARWREQHRRKRD